MCNALLLVVDVEVDIGFDKLCFVKCVGCSRRTGGFVCSQVAEA